MGTTHSPDATTRFAHETFSLPDASFISDDKTLGRNGARLGWNAAPFTSDGASLGWKLETESWKSARLAWKRRTFI